MKFQDLLKIVKLDIGPDEVNMTKKKEQVRTFVDSKEIREQEGTPIEQMQEAKEAAEKSMQEPGMMSEKKEVVLQQIRILPLTMLIKIDDKGNITIARV